MDKLTEAIKEYLEENYDTSECDDVEEASEAMRIYIVETYIPDVVGLFGIKKV